MSFSIFNDTVYSLNKGDCNTAAKKLSWEGKQHNTVAYESQQQSWHHKTNIIKNCSIKVCLNDKVLATNVEIIPVHLNNP